MLPAAGIAVPASKLLPQSVLHEIKPDKQYILKPDIHIDVTDAEMFSRALRDRGLGNITVVAGEFELYELEKAR